jgi:hypothetical protein
MAYTHSIYFRCPNLEEITLRSANSLSYKALEILASNLPSKFTSSLFYLTLSLELKKIHNIGNLDDELAVTISKNCKELVSLSANTTPNKFG